MRQTADASSLGNPLARIPSRLIPLITAEKAWNWMVFAPFPS